MPRILFLIGCWLTWLNSILAQQSISLRIRPTNSITIRQTSRICANHVFGELIQNPADCHLFYLCVDNSEAVLAVCPETMMFNPETRLCDVAANVDCSGRNDTIINSNYYNQIVTDATSFCATLSIQETTDRIIYVGSSSSCSRYYICYYGQAILQECSSNLQWNANTGKCDLPEYAQCSLQPTTNAGQVMPNNDNNGANNLGNDLLNCPHFGQHLFPHMERCEFFIYCVKGHAILQQCPFYYRFDVITKSCQWLRTAVCVRDLNLNFKK